jgi:hypothetical protein
MADKGTIENRDAFGGRGDRVMSYISQRDDGQYPKPDEAKKIQPQKSYCGVPVKEPSEAKVVRIDLERQHRGKNGR